MTNIEILSVLNYRINFSSAALMSFLISLDKTKLIKKLYNTNCNAIREVTKEFVLILLSLGFHQHAFS